MSIRIKTIAASGVAIALLAGCAGTQGPLDSSPSATVAPSATASAVAKEITEEQWLAAVDPESSDAVIALVAEPGIALVINAYDPSGMTALHYAVTNGDAEAVAALLDAGADPFRRTAKGFPARGAIHIAAAQGDVAMLQMLLDHGVGVDELDGAGGHALLWAAYKGQPEAVAFLLAKGADPALVDGSGMNAAERAEGQGFTEVADMIFAVLPNE